MTASINRKSDFVTFICYRKCSEKSGNLFTEQYLFSEILFHVDMPQKIIYIYIFFLKESNTVQRDGKNVLKILSIAIKCEWEIEMN